MFEDSRLKRPQQGNCDNDRRETTQGGGEDEAEKDSSLKLPRHTRRPKLPHTRPRLLDCIESDLPLGHESIIVGKTAPKLSAILS